MSKTSFNNDIDKVKETYPELIFNKIEKTFSGKINLYDNHDIIDVYNITIDIKPFPKDFPKLFIKDERVKRTIERHIYDTGECCLTTKAVENILLRKTIFTIEKFISDIIIPFLANQSYYELTGKFKHGFYSHGIPGIFEGYKDILKIDDLRKILYLISQRVIKNKKLRPNDICYCREKKLKKCHNQYYNDFKLINKQILEDDLEKLVKYYKKEIDEWINNK